MHCPLSFGQTIEYSDKDLLSRAYEKISSHDSLRRREHKFEVLSWSGASSLKNCSGSINVELLSFKNNVWGNQTLKFRCEGRTKAVRYLRLRVTVWGNYLTAARDISGAHVLDATDVTTKFGEITDSGGMWTESAEATIGMELVRPLREGDVIKLNDIRKKTVIKQGDFVTLVIDGQEFIVETQGVAQNGGGLGDVIGVTSRDGKFVKGVVLDSKRVLIK